jgi:DNA-binding CsgD family transcriptional regulator
MLLCPSTKETEWKTIIDPAVDASTRRVPWNKGKLVGAKPPLRPSHVWSIRTKLQMQGLTRDLALFNLAIDSKLRGCDVVAVRVDDWAVAFWSRKVLCKILTRPCRIMIFAAANFGALRLEQLAGPDISRIRSRARLTSRELAVLRLVSAGGQTRDIAQALGLGEETIRSHLKKAEIKLGVRNRTHAACEVLRQALIP